jgi:hypothetical protein
VHANKQRSQIARRMRRRRAWLYEQSPFARMTCGRRLTYDNKCWSEPVVSHPMLAVVMLLRPCMISARSPCPVQQRHSRLYARPTPIIPFLHMLQAS